MKKILLIQPSPHIASGNSVERIMWQVVFALVPVTVFAVVAFGWAGFITLTAAVLSCLLWEALGNHLQGIESTLRDGSALVTGMLYGLCLPPALPVWMVCVGAGFSIGVGKLLLGGLGVNCFNPALVGRAMLQATFPVAMTSWTEAFGAERFSTLPASTLTPPFLRPHFDGLTGATPLSAWKYQGSLFEVRELAFGMSSGSLGETSFVLIALGGVWLLVQRVIAWRVVVSMLGTVLLLALALHAFDPSRHPPADFALVSGGLVLAAVFMATDPVGSPMTPRGAVVYGIVIGTLVAVIRAWGGMPEGVMYAVLLGNALTPHLDRWFPPRAFGARSPRKAQA